MKASGSVKTPAYIKKNKMIPISLASINNTTKQIKVAPRFYELDKRVQDFILSSLKSYSETKNFFISDKKAMEAVSKKDKFKVFKKVAEILMEEPTALNRKRIQSLLNNK
jgi:hypothetical protein